MLRSIYFSASLIVATVSVLVFAVPQDITRAIISDDFTRNRPKSNSRSNTVRKSRSYRLASKSGGPTNPNWLMSAVGLTVWKLETVSSRNAEFEGRQNPQAPTQWIAKRVASDTPFRGGDSVRLSVEVPRDGYLYVVNRDWLSDGRFGDTNLIFPHKGEDNRLRAGRLVSIPAESQEPFRASPKTDQSAELLIILITSEPLRLPSYERTLPVSNAQLSEWQSKWASNVDRFEMNGGAGELRTRAEQVASNDGLRQLTRDDPPPQTILVLKPKSNDGLMFNVILRYEK